MHLLVFPGRLVLCWSPIFHLHFHILNSEFHRGLNYGLQFGSLGSETFYLILKFWIFDETDLSLVVLSRLLYIRIFAHTAILIPHSRTIWNLNWNPLSVVYLVHCLCLCNYGASHLVSLRSLGCYKLWQFILIVLPLWVPWLMKFLTRYIRL